MAARRLVVVGAGPMGLEAALCAAERGFDVTVLERGEVGDSLRRWGATRFFTPLGMNLSARARAAIERAGGTLPGPDALLTGPEMAERVLEPLARCAALAGRVRTRHRVIGIGRARMTRTDMPGHPVRHERAFRLVVEGSDGEHAIEADAVLDASGCFGNALPLGNGGLPAIGERAAGDLVLRDLGALHRRAPELGSARVLLLGHGHSAANALAILEDVAKKGGALRVTHAFRAMNARPFVEVPEDPLPERRAIVERANALVAAPPAWLKVERRAHVEALRRDGAGLSVTLTGDRAVACDLVIALTGYRPDLSILSELAVEISPVTEGAARLWSAISSVTDCLSVPAVSPRDLASGEPGFHLIGAKSYGRARTFLLQTGAKQIETIVASL